LMLTVTSKNLFCPAAEAGCRIGCQLLCFQVTANRVAYSSLLILSREVVFNGEDHVLGTKLYGELLGFPQYRKVQKRQVQR
jgi:hypothetical protein